MISIDETDELPHPKWGLSLGHGLSGHLNQWLYDWWDSSTKMGCHGDIAPRKTNQSIPRTQMGPHILEDLTHKMEGQPHKKEVS